MFKRIVLCVCACIVLGVSVAFAATHSAIDIWNASAASHHFGTYPGPASATFGSMYSGDNFQADMSAMLKLMSSPPQGGNSDDTFSANFDQTLELLDLN